MKARKLKKQISVCRVKKRIVARSLPKNKKDGNVKKEKK